jgi:hypothetical protein
MINSVSSFLLSTFDKMLTKEKKRKGSELFFFD